VTTRQRVQAIAAVPPLAEVGMPDYETASWHTVTTTAGVPRGIVDRLHEAIREAMSDPAVVQILEKDGTLPQISPPPDALKQFVAGEIVRWGKILEESGLAGLE
jgi:tripartite-type tricarboxylate transporter receptor subunit TctC